MTLPFTETAFLDVFGAYNTALWPVAVLLWVASAFVAARWLARGTGTRTLLVLLAFHWAWSGIAYHWLYFRTINPAARGFALMFVFESVVFAWLAGRGRARFVTKRSTRSMVAGALVAYALLYPFVSLSLGLHYPRVPLFAVPCPTTLLTAGLLLAGTGLPRLVGLVPLAWSVIGGSGAFLLGIRSDLVLPVAGVLLLIDILAPSALGPRGAAEN
ncbi:MAG: DUF6064 family protein [Acidobacteriota bacterium]